ncbi:hypothetical protein MMC26_000930 [Xylographa opegraphella]|nr:hypothetical protein [Xylographa opegraphella]
MSDRSPLGPGSPLLAIDPALLSLPSTPASTAHVQDPEACDWLHELAEPFQSHFYPRSAETAFAEAYQTSHFTALPDATRSAAQSPNAPFAQNFSHARAHSQPPEEVSRPDSTPPPRRPRHPYPPAQLRQLQKQSSHPYARPSAHRPLRSVAPTSAPTPEPPAAIPQLPPRTPTSRPSTSTAPRSTVPPNATNPFLPPTRTPETSTTLSITTQVHQLSAALSALQTFLTHAFAPPSTCPTRDAIETARHTARQHNHTLTELHEFLTPLPVHAGAAAAAVAPPITGEELRGLDHAALDALLDAYDVAFSPGMFLWEKKALYLRFVGAGRGLMHRVLD